MQIAAISWNGPTAVTTETRVARQDGENFTFTLSHLQPPCSSVVARHKATVSPRPESEQHLASPSASPTLPLFQERALAQRDAASLDGEETLSEPLWDLDVDNKVQRVWGSCFKNTHQWGSLPFSAPKRLVMWGSYFTFSPCEYTVA